tara:strand:+ start:233 stop:937 length:705 start_codon:yes stop_codon:yes gene_type:complete
LRNILLGIIFFVSVIITLVKIHFEYYHFIIPITLILFLWRFEVFKRQNGARRKLAYGLILLNIAIITISDSFIYKQLNSENYFWSEKKLSVSHFKGTPENDVEQTAIVFPSMIGKISRVFNYPTAVMFTADRSQESWIKKDLFSSSQEDKAILEHLINHEKRHLDLTEVYLRIAMDSINKLTFPSYDSKLAILSHYFQVSDSINDVFDNETGHGVNRKSAKKWDDYLDSKLGVK